MARMRGYRYRCYACALTCLFGTLAAAAPSPPRGWNSYDRYGDKVNSTEFVKQCTAMAARLKSAGYRYCVVDFLWYKSAVNDSDYSFDKHGRPLPHPSKWPQGFKPVADEVKKLGLVFGVHIMKGALKQAIAQNLPILGAENATLAQAADDSADGPCTWYPDFVGLKDNDAGRAFYTSVVDQMVNEWGVEFIKHDCVFGGPGPTGEPGGWAQITMTSSALDRHSPRPAYSLSPGDWEFKPERLAAVGNFANMARLTEDVWDNQGFFYDSFGLAAAGARVVQATRLPFTPDLDMLPLGVVGGPDLPHKTAPCNLTVPQQYSMMTLWSIARSPLILGSDLTYLDAFTESLITNPSALRVNAELGLARGAPVAVRAGVSVWSVSYEDGTYVAVFDVGGAGLKAVSVGFSEIGVGWGNTKCAVVDCWREDCEKTPGSGGTSMVGSLTVDVETHGVWFGKLSGCTKVTV